MNSEFESEGTSLMGQRASKMERIVVGSRK